jgi:hypothetical protein
MVGGQGTDGSVTGACELLDRAAGGWQTRQEMPTARARASAIVLPDGTLLVAGGHDGHSFLSIAETLSLEGGWQQVADMPVPMASAAAAVWREQLVELVGGTNAADPIGTTTDVGFLLGDGRWTLTQLRSGMVPLRFGRRPVPGVKSLWMVR